MKQWNRRSIVTVLLLAILAIVEVVPLRHGYYIKEDEAVPLQDGQTIRIETTRKWARAIAFLQDKGLDVSIKVTDKSGNVIVQQEVTRSMQKYKVYYYVYFPKEIKRGQTLFVTAKVAAGESVKIVTAYPHRTFTFFARKATAIIVLALMCYMYIKEIIFSLVHRNALGKVLILSCMAIVMSWCFYSFNTRSFQADSEALVKNTVDAAYSNTPLQNNRFPFYWSKDDMTPRVSNFGLHARVIRSLSRVIPHSYVYSIFHLLCNVLLSIVLTAIVFFVRKKGGYLIAFCFYVGFTLSPWIINFANNLYWVEFTWFTPMLIGLIASVYIIEDNNSAACRVPRAACRVPRSVLYNNGYLCNGKVIVRI